MNTLERRLAWALIVSLLVCMVMIANLTRQVVNSRAIAEETRKAQDAFDAGTLKFRTERTRVLDTDAGNVKTLLDDLHREEHEYVTEHRRTQNMLRTLGAYDPSTQP